MEDTGIYSGVSTPNHGINLVDAQVLRAPREKSSAPTHVAHLLDQKAWSPQYEWDEEDFGV